ncbi:MAG TPA: hypothetical protein DCF44_08060, partial [Chitinophagaceae bacterium]|nr:hypothetical protein [Chitinophagaceae bacterium]
HYYGGQQIRTSQFLYTAVICTNRLKNNCEGATLYTRKEGSNNLEDYRSTDNNWPNQNDKVGITGHWCLEKTYEAYKNLFGINSFNNAFAQVNLVIDSQGESQWFENTDIINIAKFQNTNSFQVVLDIVGHEFGHGVLNNSSGLGANGMDLSSLNALNQSALEGTMAEGFSDIFGQLVEYYVNNNYSTTGAINDFVHGGNNPAGFVCGQTRSQMNPHQTCNPTTLNGPDFLSNPLTLNDNVVTFLTKIHQNTTILSHWFFLLSQGGTGTNDAPFNNYFCVKPIGQLKAGRIAFLAATNFITTNGVTLTGLRQAAIDAANALYGFNSHESAQVAAAWYAVGIGNINTIQIDVQNLTVNNQQDFHYNNKILVKNVTTNPGALFYVSSNTEIELTNDINMNSGTWAELYITPQCAGGARAGNNEETPSIQESSLESFSIENSKKPSLNSSVNMYKDIAVRPNPTNGDFQLSLGNSENGNPTKVVVRNIEGKEIQTISNPSKELYELSLTKEPSGVYMISIYYDKNVVNKKIIKN